ncbi:MAG TPA: helix-turn-helix transcriptional regulator [Gallicola sp.]|nr:helix-turn-helix transcriptional regulator [Gallicola sp.]
MKISEAIAQRILNLCDSKNISINKLAIMSGLTQSTVQSIICGKSKNPKLLTIVRICDSLNIKLEDFFADKLFNNLDIEL